MRGPAPWGAHAPRRVHTPSEFLQRFVFQCARRVGVPSLRHLYASMQFTTAVAERGITQGRALGCTVLVLFIRSCHSYNVFFFGWTVPSVALRPSPCVHKPISPTGFRPVEIMAQNLTKQGVRLTLRCRGAAYQAVSRGGTYRKADKHRR